MILCCFSRTAQPTFRGILARDRRLRNFIAHAYFALDLDIIWDAVTRDVPALLAAVKGIIETEKQGGE